MTEIKLDEQTFHFSMSETELFLLLVTKIWEKLYALLDLFIFPINAHPVYISLNDLHP